MLSPDAFFIYNIIDPDQLDQYPYFPKFSMGIQTRGYKTFSCSTQLSAHKN